MGSDLTWQLQGTLVWNFTKNWFAEIGYRYLAMDYSSGNFTYDIDQAGTFLGLGYKF